MGQTKRFGGTSPDKASRAVLTLGQGQDPPESTWSPLLGGGICGNTAELQTPGLLPHGVRGEEAPGPCFRSPWQRGLECHSASGLSVLLLQGNAHRGWGGGSLEEHRHCPPSPSPSPDQKTKQNKNTNKTKQTKKTRMSERCSRQIGCNLRATFWFSPQRFVHLL